MAAAVDALLGGSSEARRRATSPPLQRSEPCRACSRSCSRPTESANACASGERRSGRCLGHNARRVEEGLGRAPLHEGSRPPCWLRSPLLRRRRWPRRRRAARPPALVLAARGSQEARARSESSAWSCGNCYTGRTVDDTCGMYFECRVVKLRTCSWQLKNQSVPSYVQLTSRLLPPYPRNPGLWQRAPQLQPCTCQLPPDA